MRKGLVNFLHGVFMFAVVFGAAAFWLQVIAWILLRL